MKSDFKRYLLYEDVKEELKSFDEYLEKALKGYNVKYKVNVRLYEGLEYFNLDLIIFNKDCSIREFVELLFRDYDELENIILSLQLGSEALTRDEK